MFTQPVSVLEDFSCLTIRLTVSGHYLNTWACPPWGRITKKWTTIYQHRRRIRDSPPERTFRFLSSSSHPVCQVRLPLPVQIAGGKPNQTKSKTSCCLESQRTCCQSHGHRRVSRPLSVSVSSNSVGITVKSLRGLPRKLLEVWCLFPTWRRNKQRARRRPEFSPLFLEEARPEDRGEWVTDGTATWTWSGQSEATLGRGRSSHAGGCQIKA